MICNPFDVVEVPFPFSDRNQAKRRKALVLSSTAYNETNSASVMMMITSAHAGAWLGDTQLTQWETAGLKKPCIARVKLFTLDNALILEKVGTLTATDRKAVVKSLKTTLPA